MKSIRPVCILYTLLFSAILGSWILWNGIVNLDIMLLFVFGVFIFGVIVYLRLMHAYKWSSYRFTDDMRLICINEYSPIPLSIPIQHILKVQPVWIYRPFLWGKFGLRLYLGGKYAYWPYPVVICPENEILFIEELRKRNPNILTSEEVTSNICQIL